MWTHTKDKTREYQACKKKVLLTFNRNARIIINTGDKLKCDIFKKRFSQKISLVCHRRIHTQKRKPSE